MNLLWTLAAALACLSVAGCAIARTQEARACKLLRADPKASERLDFYPPAVRAKAAFMAPPVGPTTYSDDVSDAWFTESNYRGQIAGPPMNIAEAGPSYPNDALLAGIEGHVILQGDVTEAGTVANLVILYSEPVGRFDEVCRSSVSQWRYRPYVVDGKPAALPARLFNCAFCLQ